MMSTMQSLRNNLIPKSNPKRHKGKGKEKKEEEAVPFDEEGGYLHYPYNRWYPKVSLVAHVVIQSHRAGFMSS